MARDLNSPSERNTEGGVVAPPAENDSLMLKIWIFFIVVPALQILVQILLKRTFLRDNNHVKMFLLRTITILMRLLGFTWMLMKIFEFVNPGAFSRPPSLIWFVHPALFLSISLFVLRY